jgi:hypothetical protein
LPATQVGLPDLRIKKPISGRPEIGAQFQLWIFSYTILAGSSKKYVSRVMIDFANDFALLI